MGKSLDRLEDDDKDDAVEPELADDTLETLEEADETDDALDRLEADEAELPDETLDTLEDEDEASGSPWTSTIESYEPMPP